MARRTLAILPILVLASVWAAVPPAAAASKPPVATPTPEPDYDGDSVPDWSDNCIDVYNPGQEDLDGDGLPDACEEDYLPEEPLPTPTPPPKASVPPSQTPPGTATPFPQPTPFPPPGDGTPGADHDLDGVADEADNCVFIPNSDQLDVDADGIGDMCDEIIETPDPGCSGGDCGAVHQDFDGDGVTDDVFTTPTSFKLYASGLDGALAGLHRFPASQHIGAGKIYESWNIVAVSLSLGELKWTTVDLEGARTSFAVFGRRGDSPVIGCHSGNSLFPAVVTTTSDKSPRKMLEFEPPFSPVLTKLLPRPTTEVLCSYNLYGESEFLALLPRKSRTLVVAYDLFGSEVWRSPALPLTDFTAQHLLLLPSAEGLVDVAVITQYKSSVTLSIYDRLEDAWLPEQILDVLPNELLAVSVGSRAGENPWINLQTRRGMFSVWLSPDKEVVNFSQWAVNLSAQERLLGIQIPKVRAPRVKVTKRVRKARR